MAEVVYSMGVLEEQLRETCALNEVDILFSMFNDQGPPTPSLLGKGAPWQRPLWSPTSPPASPKGPPSIRPNLASIDALFTGCVTVFFLLAYLVVLALISCSMSLSQSQFCS